MDDFVISNLHESRNEWCTRLVSILTPLVIGGLRSIFNEAWKLCTANDEMNKYLDVDMIIMSAAIADYTPTHKSDIKIKRDNENLSVNMKPTIDIIQAIAKKTKALIVAFALETSDGEKNAKNKLTNKGVDYIILNHPDEDNCGIDSNYNKVIIFDKNNNKKEFHKDRKDRIANNVMKFIINQEKQKNKI